MAIKLSENQQDLHQIFVYIGLLCVGIGVTLTILQYDAEIVIGITIGIAILIFAIVNPEYSIYILILSMLLSPEYGERATDGSGQTLRLDDFFITIITFVWLMRMAITKELGLVLRTELNRPIFIYISLCAVSTILGMIGERVVYTTGTFHIIKYLQYYVIFFMIVNNIKSRDQIRNFLTLLFFTAVIVAIISIIQIPSGERISAPFEGEGGEPNTLGGYLVLMLGVSISLLIYSPNFTYKLIFSSITSLLFIPLLFSQSRSSWFSFAVLYVMLVLSSKKKTLLLMILLGGILTFPYYAPESVVERFNYTFSGSEEIVDVERAQVGDLTLDASTSERVDSWRRVWNDLPKHPLLGFGVTGWRFLDAQYFKILIETGVIGLALFLFLKFSVLKVAWSVYRRDDYDDWLLRGLSLGCFAVTFGMLAHGLGTNTFIIVRIMEPFWAIVGMTVMIPEVIKTGEVIIEKHETIPFVVEKPFLVR
ncbi:O-antigen ligase family protein [bacterium]|nr:O-antigen ligase family protein [bacterium]